MMTPTQQIPQGYKLTEVGIIPDDWEIKRLDNVFEITAGRDLVKRDFSVNYDHMHPYPIYSNSLENKGLYGFTKKPRYKENCITITARGTIGKANARDHKFDAIGRLLILSPTTNLVCYFLAEYINHRIKFSIESTGVPQLTAPQASLYYVAFPNSIEQAAIAAILSDLDSLLKKFKKLISKKQALKQGMMQELLTGNRRLPGYKEKWEEVTFDQAFHFLQTASYSREQLNQTGTVFYVHYGDIHMKWHNFLDFSINTAPHIDEEKIKNFGFLKEGDLIIADASEDYDGIGKSVEVKNLGHKKAIAGLHTLLLRDKSNYFTNGFRGYITTIPRVKTNLNTLATGLKVYGISKNNLKTVSIPKPPIPEQKAIVKILNDMETEIIALEIKLQKFKKIKKSVMQVLLTGKIRLVKN